MRRYRRAQGLRLRWSLGGLVLLALLAGIVLSWPDPTPVVGFVTTAGPDPNPVVVDAATSRAFVYNRTAGSVSTIDTASGVLVRTVPLGTQSAWMAVDRRTQHLFVSSMDNSITMLDARSGRMLYQVTDVAAISVRQIAVDEASNHVFVGNLDSATVTMLDARRGAILRHIPVCTGPFAVGVSASTGHVFAKCTDDTITMLDAQTGQVIHTTAIPNNTYGGVVVDERTNRVFAYSWDSGQIDVLDARTDAHLWTLPFGGDPAVDAGTGRVFVAPVPVGGPLGPLPRSEVVELDGWTGRIRRRFPVAAHPQTSVVDPTTGHLLVVSTGPIDSSGQPQGDGVLSVLDTHSGAILHRLVVGMNPTSLAIDAQDRRALIGTETGDCCNGTVAATLTTSPPEGGWPRIRRELLQRLKGVLPWLPVHVPSSPSPPNKGTVTTLNLTRL